MSLRSWVLELLKSFDWGRYGVAYAVLFGSLARGFEKPRDVDVAISCLDRRCDGDAVLELYADLARVIELATHLQLDLVVLDWDPPCELVTEVFKYGIVVYEASPSLFLDDMLRRVAICYDWSVARKKLRIVETAEEVVLRGRPV